MGVNASIGLFAVDSESSTIKNVSLNNVNYNISSTANNISIISSGLFVNDLGSNTIKNVSIDLSSNNANTNYLSNNDNNLSTTNLIIKDNNLLIDKTIKDSDNTFFIQVSDAVNFKITILLKVF